MRFPDRVVGVVGRFDPFAPDVPGRLASFVANPAALAVRFTLMTEETARWLPERRLDPFFAAAAELGVAVQLYTPGLAPEVMHTVRRFPEIRFLVDHMALRHQHGGEDVFADWPGVLAMADEPNVWVKVSYFPEASLGLETFPYPQAQLRFRELYERVGASRLIWGSNFPPVSAVCTYEQSLEFVRDHCAFLPAADRAAILGENFLRDFGPRAAPPT